MDYPLYMNKDKYFLIINKALNYSIAIDFDTFNNILISNDIISNSVLIEFNEENLKKILNIDYDNFIINNNKICRFNNWLDVFNYYKNI
jgi:hypothetical protein